MHYSIASGIISNVKKITVKSNIIITTIWNHILQNLEEPSSKATGKKGQNKHVTCYEKTEKKPTIILEESII